MVWLKWFGLLIGVITLAMGTVPASAQSRDWIRGVNWPVILTRDSELRKVPTPAGTMVEWRQDDAINGYPLLDEILYGDLDGDGFEEAVIPLHSGGTAGVIALLVYQEVGGRVTIVATYPGYKLRLDLDEEEDLLVGEPEYGPDDPNCCPSQIRVVKLRLTDRGLVPMDLWYESPN